MNNIYIYIILNDFFSFLILEEILSAFSIDTYFLNILRLWEILNCKIFKNLIRFAARGKIKWRKGNCFTALRKDRSFDRSESLDMQIFACEPRNMQRFA